MNKKWLLLFSAASTLLAGSFVIAALVTSWSRESSISVWEGTKSKKILPISAFRQSEDSYHLFAETLLHLHFEAPELKVPDLTKILSYLGQSGRPDATSEKNAVYFALANNKDLAAVAPGEKLYLLYDRTAKPAHYTFSPKNEPTALWMEVESADKAANVQLSLQTEDGEIIQTPEPYAHFSLPTKEFARMAKQEPWELDKWRVDGTLLARQKAKWYGEDKFFEKHGGEEFVSILNKQRLDFGEGEELYSVFVREGDSLVWMGKKWEVKEAGHETKNKPLMQVKKIADRLLTFDLWNNDGSSKISLNLLKTQERWSVDQIQNEFKFLSAKTRSQYVFEVNGTRMTLSPQDWLIKTENGWEKLESSQDIDLFVDRKIQGPLFVFDGVVKQGDKQMLIGSLFNSSRTEVETIELDVPQSSVTVIRVPKGAEKIIEHTNSEQATTRH